MDYPVWLAIQDSGFEVVNMLQSPVITTVTMSLFDYLNSSRRLKVGFWNFECTCIIILTIYVLKLSDSY